MQRNKYYAKVYVHIYLQFNYFWYMMHTVLSHSFGLHGMMLTNDVSLVSETQCNNLTPVGFQCSNNNRFIFISADILYICLTLTKHLDGISDVSVLTACYGTSACGPYSAINWWDLEVKHIIDDEVHESFFDLDIHS